MLLEGLFAGAPEVMLPLLRAERPALPVGASWGSPFLMQIGAQCFALRRLLLASPSWPELTLQGITTLRRSSLISGRFQVLPLLWGFVPLTQAHCGADGLMDWWTSWDCSAVVGLYSTMQLLSVKVAQLPLSSVLSCSADTFPGRGSNGSEGEQNYGQGLLWDNLR